MGHLDHATFGWLTPVLSFAMATVGAALALRCTARAPGASERSRRNWLIAAASVLGAGLWTMHVVAMLGFRVRGTDIRYDVPLTVLSLVVALLGSGAGMFIVGYGRKRRMALVLGGLTTGLGVAAMHYLGMAALHLSGDLSYDVLFVALSLVIAVAAATAALWGALNITAPLAAAVASVVVGTAFCGMHYTAMAAVSFRISSVRTELPGVTATQFIVPLVVGLGSYLFLTAAFVALSPAACERLPYADPAAAPPAAPPAQRPTEPAVP